MMNSKETIDITEKYSAHNYHPLPIVIARAEGIWVWDPEGNKYLDMLSAYSAVSHGHRHPRIIKALKDQADKVTLASRAFHTETFGPFAKMLCELCDMEMVLPMNTGAEAVETAIKAARKWGYLKKHVQSDKAEIIVCEGNFHGRTTTVVSFSSDKQYKEGFGPFTPGFKIIPYGDSQALENAINENTVAFLVEPIQGEAGIVIPPDGYLTKARELCTKNNVLLMCDEIQTGLGRTGRVFASDHENVKPDVYILGKTLGGGVFPVSAVVANKNVLDVFTPGDHGSTFGGNPLGCAVAMEALLVLKEEQLTARSEEMGNYLMNKLNEIDSPYVDHIRGKGLFIGVVLKESAGGARRFCEALKEAGILCKETHENVIRFAPPLIIEKEDLDTAIEKVKKVLSE
ncbi:MAG: ornithine--oxo-acid transaminase [Pseudomonadota bacterium]